MQPIEYVRRNGFRRWYERQLIEAHAYLAMGFLALIALLAGAEVLSDAKAGMAYLGTLLMSALGGILVFVAWYRFKVLLDRAERFAEGATCPGCKAWGRFRVLSQESCTENDPPEACRPRWLRVQCAQCGDEWRIE